MKDSIDIPITCIKCKKYGHHATECEKGEKAKKGKDKLPNVHTCFKTIFKDLSSKVMLRNPFMDLLYPLLMKDEWIKITILVFGFTSTQIPKEIYSLNNVAILKDIIEVRIYRTERSLSSLKTEISLDDQLTDNDIKKSKQDIETEICSYSPIAFLHRHRHIVQTPCEKEFGGKEIKDGTILIISFSQYEWIDSLTDVPNKIIINDILTPFIVFSNTAITNVLIKEALADSPLLIIKENINCGNFLNNYKFNFFTGKVNQKLLTDFPQTITVVNKRLYGEALFHIFLQNEIYSNTYMDRIMANFENNNCRGFCRE